VITSARLSAGYTSGDRVIGKSGLSQIATLVLIFLCALSVLGGEMHFVFGSAVLLWPIANC
jgi:hypothetical protein